MLRRLLLVHLVLAVLLGVGLLVAAYEAVRAEAEVTARRHIESDIHLLTRSYRDAGVLGVADEIEYRATMPVDQPSAGAAAPPRQSAYLLLRSDGTRVVGSLLRWPDGIDRRPGWLHFDGAAAGVPGGRIIARASRIDGKFLLLVGQRPSSIDALARDFAPTALAIIAAPCLFALLITLRVDRRYRASVAAINSAFDAVRAGKLDSAIDLPSAAAPQELIALADNVNLALADIARMVGSLDASSQAAAHELNRELTRLRDAARTEGATHFVTASNQLIALLRQLLELSRIGSGTTLDWQPVDLVGLARDALQLYADALDAVGASGSLDVSAHDGSAVQGHADLISGAIVNLVENAVKHSPPGGMVRIAIASNPHEVTITVADEGPGSTANDIGELIAAGATPGEEGYGFGLRLVQAVAIRHGARVAIGHATPGLIVTLGFRRPNSSIALARRG